MFRKIRPPVGSKPGTLVTSQHSVQPKISMFQFTKEEVHESIITDVDSLANIKTSNKITWIDVQGLGSSETLEKIGSIFGIHLLALEDVVNIPQRPKYDDYSGDSFIVLQMITAPNLPRIQIEQMSMFVSENVVITFQENYGDVLDPVRRRIISGSKLRAKKADYLAYAIMDAVVDGYFPVLEQYAEYLEELEEKVLSSEGNNSSEEVYKAKRELHSFRRNVFPHRELFSSIIRTEDNSFSKDVNLYLRDCHDHTVQVLEVIETYGDVCSSLMDLYLHSQSNKLNEVMKVLTIIATIFIPLSFLAGVYGMNFEYMPELRSKWAYPIFWGVAITVAGSLLLLFKKLGWLRTKE